MKNIKIILASILSLFVVSASNAGELSVTGSVKASISNGSGLSTDGGNTLGISNDIDFNASGELENGWTWTWQAQMDGASANTSTSGIDDTRLVLGTSYGNIGLFGTEGALNAKHSGSQNAIGVGSSFNNAGGVVDAADIGGVNNIQYHTPAGLLPLGTTIKVAYGLGGSETSDGGDVAGAARTWKDARSYAVDLSPIDGLTLGATYYTIATQSATADSNQKAENGAYYAAYKIGQVGLGYSRNVNVPAHRSTAAGAAGADLYTHYLTDSYSIGYVMDNLSISYGYETSERNLITNAVEYDTKIDTIQAAYTTGGMTISTFVKDIENAGYTNNKDQEEFGVILAIAF